MPTIATKLAALEAEEEGGGLITKIGKKRLASVRRIVSDAIRRDLTPFGAEKQLKRQAGTKTDKRDWGRVLRTEITNARGKSSFELLASAVGPNGIVYRSTSDCCDSCAKIFGPPGRPRRWRVKQVKPWMQGALHPNCKCGVWMSDKLPELTKAERVLPFGWVRRVMEGTDYRPEVSTGAAWVDASSVTGRAVIRAVLMAMPLVVVDEQDGYTLARHGHGRVSQPFYQLLSPGQVRGARYYDRSPLDVPHLREVRFRQARSFDEYVTKILEVMPIVLGMPDFWPTGAGIKYLTEFMGFKQMTDWWVLIPGEPSDVLATVPLSRNVRAAVRETVKQAMSKNSLRKVSL